MRAQLADIQGLEATSIDEELAKLADNGESA